MIKGGKRGKITRERGKESLFWFDKQGFSVYNSTVKMALLWGTMQFAALPAQSRNVSKPAFGQKEAKRSASANIRRAGRGVFNYTKRRPF